LFIVPAEELITRDFQLLALYSVYSVISVVKLTLGTFALGLALWI